MTKPKRWPQNAEAARVESLAAAREIQSLGLSAQAATRKGKRDLCLAMIAEIRLCAKEIELQLKLCKG